MTDEAKAMPGWTVETLHTDYRQSLRAARVLYDSETDHQRLRVLENPTFGRILTLDDVVQTTTADEFIYHEMLAHVPIFGHGAVWRVAIVGGGDGGMAREVLRHKGVETVTMVEIDQGVIDFSREYLPSLSDGAFDDPRLNVVIDDGAAFMANCEDIFDVIIVDSTDPLGPGAALFTREFYENCRKCLAGGGVIVTQNGVPFMQGDELRQTMDIFSDLFTDRTCYLATIPTYAGGPMAFGWGSDTDLRTPATYDVLVERMKTCGFNTKYYNPSVHLAAFALPNYVKNIVSAPKPARPIIAGPEGWRPGEQPDGDALF